MRWKSINIDMNFFLKNLDEINEQCVKQNSLINILILNLSRKSMNKNKAKY